MIVWSMPYDLSLEWQTIESEHFLVIFPGKSPTLQHFEYQEFAFTVADTAEETYQKLIPNFGEPYNKNRKTAIILEDFSDSVYGFATVLPHPAIRINLTAPGFKTFDTKFKSWLEILIAHEYTHIAHFDMNSKATSFLRLFLGQIIAPNALQPMWAIEGLAIFYESKLGSGGRVTDNRYDMYLRSDFLEENPIDLKLLKDTYFTSWPGGNIPYIYGQSLVHYIAQEYGEEKLLDISEYFCANPLLGINWSIKKALGINQNDLYKNWEDKKLSQYQEQLENVYSFSEITHSEQITNHHYWVDNPIWLQKDNNDKAILLYRVNIPELYPTIRSYNQLNKEESIIINRTTGHGTSYSLSPDNKYLIYSKLQIFKEFYQYYDLFLFNLQNGNQIQLSEGMRIKDPGWHPSKSEYNVVAVINIAGSSNLVLFSLENTFPSLFGGNNKNTDFTSSKNEMLTFEDLLYLTSFNDGTQISQPVWSPDGKKIAFSMWQNGYQDIYILELGTANEIKYLNPIIRDKHIDISPSWSADGEYIYFTSDRSGIFNLYAYQLKEKILFRLTNVTTGAFEPAGSPDGKEIAFIQYHSTGYELHLAETKNLLWKPVSFETQTNTGDGSLYQVNISHKPIQGTVLCIRNKNKEQSPVSYSPWDSLFPTYWIPYFNLTSKDLYLGFSSTAQDYLGYYYLPFKLAKGVFTPSLYYDFHFIQYSQNPN
ncbi:MAG: hypothetical protein PHD33_04955, partial [Atribacterota bacterium]|nr:hypothetical protein [Atribacterota bacterium]